MFSTTQKGLGVALFFFLSANAGAVPIACDTGIASNITASSACQLGSTNNDFLNPLQVNVDELFGYSDWVFGQKAFDNDLDIDFGLSLLGGAQSGNWSINDIWDDYSDVMIVVNGGAGNNTIPSYVGYLLTQETISGTYLTPFANLSNGNPKDISHLSIYARGSGPIPVSQPAMLALLFAGLTGIALSRKMAD